MMSDSTEHGSSLDSPRSIIKEEDIKYSWDDVDKHRSVDDCWMVIEGKVYDVLGYRSILAAS